MSNVPTIVMHGVHHRPRLREFLKLVDAESASIQYSGKYPTWLFKPSDKGGKTIGKIIDASGKAEVHDLITKEWQAADDARKARLRKEMEKFERSAPAPGFEDLIAPVRSAKPKGKKP